MLAVLTMEGFSPRFRSGTAARVTRNSPRTFTAKTRSQSSTLTASRSLGGVEIVVPALLMSASSPPNASSTVAQHRAHRVIVGDIAGDQQHLRARILRFRGDRRAASALLL